MAMSLAVLNAGIAIAAAPFLLGCLIREAVRERRLARLRPQAADEPSARRHEANL